jgi:hypothetical protein
MQKPQIDLSGQRFALMTPEERSTVLYGGKFQLLGNLSEWSAKNPEAAKQARAIAQERGILGPRRTRRNIARSNHTAATADSNHP